MQIVARGTNLRVVQKSDSFSLIYNSWHSILGVLMQQLFNILYTLDAE